MVPEQLQLDLIHNGPLAAISYFNIPDRSCKSFQIKSITMKQMWGFGDRQSMPWQNWTTIEPRWTDHPGDLKKWSH